MMLGRRTKMLGVLAVVLLIGVPYAVYAMHYQGEYRVDVSMTVVMGDYRDDMAVTDLTVTSEPMGVLSFFDVLKGKSGGLVGNYSVYAALNQSGTVKTQVTHIQLSVLGSSEEVTLQFFEVKPGTAQLRVYIIWNYLDQELYDATTPVVIG